MKSTTPTIRPATPADQDAIWAIMEPVIREGLMLIDFSGTVKP